jgi:glycosyltransferase involved in cell wall biosynthesis
MSPVSSGTAPRVLIIAYYVPPAGGPAVQRILQFVEFLQEEGWVPEVLTVRHGVYPNRDPSLLDRIPSSVRVHRTRALDPYALYQAFTGTSEGELPTGSMPEADEKWREAFAKWVRANVFIPDARVGWWPFAVCQGQRLLKTGRFDALITSGAPHSVHLIGDALHAWTGCPWVADLHDPWTDIGYYEELPHTWWARRIDAALERHVLSTADAVTTVSPSWADLFAEKATNRYHVVENGFNEQEFAGVDESVPTDSFVLSHVGKLYASRNPTALWAALRQLRKEGAIPQLTVRLTGPVAPTVWRSIEAHGLTDIVQQVSFRPHAEAIREMARSTLLLLVIESFAQAEGMITSKLYEYLASERPVLGVGPSTGDAHALLEEHDAGTVVDWGNASEMAAVLRTHYVAWERGTPRSGATRSALANHSRRYQAHRMAQVLSGVTTGTPSTVPANRKENGR